MALNETKIEELSASPTLEDLSERTRESKATFIPNIAEDGGSSKKDTSNEKEFSSLPPVDKVRGILINGCH